MTERNPLPLGMTARVSVSFNFEAAHWSPEWPADHPNRRMHGHSYVAEIIAEGPVDDIYGGTVCSAERLEAIAVTFKPTLDHRLLNEIEDLPYPTMEHLAHWLLRRARLNFDQVVRVRISRPTLGQWAETA